MAPSPATTSPPPRRPGRPRDPALPARRREQILRAATRRFARHGFDATDLQDVADALRVGKGTIYRYFPTKGVLFQAAVDRVMSLMKSTIDAAIDGVDEPLERIRAAVRAYLRFFHEHPAYVELLIQERAAFRDRTTPTYFEFRKANVGRWHELYRALIRAGRVRDMPVERITDFLGNLVYGTMFTNYLAHRTASVADQADEILDIAFHGLLTPPHKEPRP